MMSDVSCVSLVRGPRARTTLRPFRWAYGCHTQMRDSDRKWAPEKKTQGYCGLFSINYFRNNNKNATCQRSVYFFSFETPSTAELHRSRQHTGAHRPGAVFHPKAKLYIQHTRKLFVRKEALWGREADPPRGIAWVVCSK